MPELKTIEVDSGAPLATAGVSASAHVVIARRATPTFTQTSSRWPSKIARQASRRWSAGRLALAAELDHGRLFLCAPVLAGAGAVAWFEFDTDASLFRLGAWITFLALVFVAAGAGRPLPRRAALAGLLCVGGMLAAQIETWRAGTIILDSAVTTTLTGRVERREGDDKGRWRYILAVERTASPALKRMPERVSLLARGDAPIPIGSWIEVRARFTPPAGPALPGLNDFAFDAYFAGVGANGFAYGEPVEVAPDALSPRRSAPDTIVEGLYRLRSSIGERIRSILPGDTGAFAASLVTDERRAISDETTEALRQSGLAHIVAISGLNMALSAGIFFIGLRAVFGLFPAFAQAYPTKKIAAAGALAALTAYYLISGFAVSAERAYIMMAIMLVAALFDRPSISLRNVALSALLIILTSPSAVLGPSFQMSFAATLALVSGYVGWISGSMPGKALFVHPVFKPIGFVFRFFAGIALTSMIGGFSTALFSIEHFHRLSAYGLPANLMAMPVISFVVMPMGMLAMLLTPLGLDVLPWKIAGFGLDIVIDIAKTVSGWGGTVDVGRLPAWYFAVASLAFLLQTLLFTRLKYLGFAVMLIATACLRFLPGSPLPELLVSDDGSLVAVVDDEVLATNKPKPGEFIFNQWQRALAIEPQVPPLILTDVPPPPQKRDHERVVLTAKERRAATDLMRRSTETTQFSCAKSAWCAVTLKSGYLVVVVDNLAYLGSACDVADIVITPARVRLAQCRSGSLLFTGDSLRRTGALEIRIDDQGSPVINTAYTGLDRPWMRQRAYDWRTGAYADAVRQPSDTGGSARQAYPVP
ncbi:ComEC family competence protein [Rhizobium grahamii]|uniref:ComEC family competence protein n=1 Tax=Rhizobium grahamii TaxID=1120045 RepID=A0A5Q0C6T9_9HYPH|nr:MULTISPECIES: ComEC/Rec2 family competence protein [Rhizobium]QFY60024.1 ComEC family competence protein [Rhizobium grahamii]QRM50856.1 ComEC family competence protein [Rhizobium sp. BG6]